MSKASKIQRGRILAAVVDVVGEVGFGRTTVARIIARARVSRRTFYDAFYDREDCFLAAFEEALERAGQLAVEAYARESGWREGIRASLARLLAFMDEEPALARLCLVEALAAGDRVLERRAQVIGELAAVVDRGRLLTQATVEPSEVTAEGVVGAVLALLHSRLLEDRRAPLSELLGPLMSMIVLPYLGTRAASRELNRPAQLVKATPSSPVGSGARDPLAGLKIRLTYRTVRVLMVIAAHPGASNREIGEASGVLDQGQISTLLARLARLKLVRNTGGGQQMGASNSWHLTERGVEVERLTRLR